jgi:outer membrane protein TolC
MTKRSILIQALLMILFFICSSNSIAAQTMSWQEIVRLTKKHNIDLIVAEKEIEIARRQRSITKSGQNPKLSTGVSLRKSRDLSAASSSDSEQFSLDLSYLIYDGDKTRYNLLAEEEAIKYYENNYLVTESNTRLELRAGFCALLQSQELIKLTEAISKRRQQQLALVQLRYKAGLEHRGSLLTAEANYKKAIFELNQAKRNLIINQKSFVNVIGVTSNYKVDLEFDVGLQTKTEITPDFEKIVMNIPLFRTILFRKNQANYNTEALKGNYLPRIYASAGTGKDISALNENNFVYDDWSVGVNFSYDIFDGDKRDNELVKSQIQLVQNEWTLKKSFRDILLTMESVWTAFINAVDEELVSQSFVTASEERSTIAEAQYSSGLISFDNWTIIEDALINSQKKYLNARINTLISEAKWIQAKGGVLDEI